MAIEGSVWAKAALDDSAISTIVTTESGKRLFLIGAHRHLQQLAVPGRWHVNHLDHALQGSIPGHQPSQVVGGLI